MRDSRLPDPSPVRAPLRLLLVGAGKMGWAHAAAFSSMPDVEIVGVVSQTGTSAERLAAKYAIRRWGNDWLDVAEKTQPDACVIAVSHLLNEPITREVIDRGFHLLSEKPVALTSRAIRSLAEAARQRNLIAMAAMNRRFYPSVMTALDMVRFYGRVRGVTVIAPDFVALFQATAKYDPKVYENWVRMNTIHAIDLLRMVGGEIESVCGRVQVDRQTNDRSIAAALQFRGGAIGSFVSYGSHSGQWELRIHGENVEAHLTPFERGVVRIGNNPPLSLPSSEDADGLKPGLRSQSRAFVESILDLGHVPAPGSDLFDHARTMQLVEELEALPEVNLSSTERPTA